MIQFVDVVLHLPPCSYEYKKSRNKRHGGVPFYLGEHYGRLCNLSLVVKDLVRIYGPESCSC